MAKKNNKAVVVGLLAMATVLLLVTTISAAVEGTHDQHSSRQYGGMVTTSSAAGAFGSGMSFQQCYVGCFVLCAIQPTETLSSCGFQCFRDCLLPPPNRQTTMRMAAGSNDGLMKVNSIPETDSLYFCNLGCASTQCSNISSLDNPRGKEVTGCVRSCAGVCGKNYSSHMKNSKKEDETVVATP